jgi:hypothetical protein
MSLTRWLFRFLRYSRDAKALSSGNPKKITRRAKNRAVAYGLRKSGFWRWLWK